MASLLRLSTTKLFRRPPLSCSVLNRVDNTARRSLGHTVRVIVQEDLPNGKAYVGDVVEVKAGYARNFLIPTKKVVYATLQNFQRLGVQDPLKETEEERLERLAREQQASAADDADLKAADILKSYLRGKVLKIWRNADPMTKQISPGMVDSRAVRRKLSKQLKIDLEKHERVHLVPEPVSFEELKAIPDLTDKLMEGLGDSETKCAVEIKELGEYLARISLRGGYSIPLRVEVVKR